MTSIKNAGTRTSSKGPDRRKGEEIQEEILCLVEKNAAFLSRYAGKIARDETIIQDAVQETFLRYFVARVAGQKMENPRAWLFRVLRNYIVDCRRRMVPAVELEAAAQIPDSRQDTEADYHQSESLRRALSLLSPRERGCVHLRLQGRGYAEIAEILQIRSGTVAALLTRALRKIRRSDSAPGH